MNIARAYTGKGLPLPDLIEEGNLGLLRAVEGFDPTMNTRFSTYASYWIKQSIKRALVNSAKTIRIPAYMVELLTKWRRATAKLQEAFNRTPTPEEVAAELGLPKKKLKIVKKAIQLYNSTPQSDQSETGWSLGEMIADERAKGPEAEMIETDNIKHVFEMLDAWSPAKRRFCECGSAWTIRNPNAQGNRRNAGPHPRTGSPNRKRSPQSPGPGTDRRLIEWVGSFQLSFKDRVP